MYRAIFAVAMIIMLMIFLFNAMLIVNCYRKGDPSDISCYMLSNRHDLTIRNR